MDSEDHAAWCVMDELTQEWSRMYFRTTYGKRESRIDAV
jgi:hypothetical protein